MQDFEHGLSAMDRLCELKKLPFDSGHIPDYENTQVQQLYFLRYFPASLVEYYLISRKLINFNFLTHFKMFSLGCGANIDYYGFYYALRDHAAAEHAENFSYTGLDKTDWCYKEDLGRCQYSYINGDISLWQSLDADDYNVIIFPKSIGEFSNRVFNHVQKILLHSNFTEKNIVLISSVREQHSPTDMYRFEIIANILRKNFGYTNLDNCTTYYHIRDAGTGFGLSRCCDSFYYPDEVKHFLLNLQNQCPIFKKYRKSCQSDCQDLLNRNPILTARYIQFQINRFTRE